MRTESWCGHEIRFVEINGEWYAILKDICDALNLKTFKVSQRLDPDMIEGFQLSLIEKATDLPNIEVKITIYFQRTS